VICDSTGSSTMNIPNRATTQHDGILGPLPTLWYGAEAIAADVAPWLEATIGSIYFTPTGNWTKGTNGWTTIEPGMGLNVRWFGAKGDGTTDDTAAFQAAINAAVTYRQCRVLVPAGHYRVSNITIKNGVYLIGEGTKKVGSTAAQVIGSWVQQTEDTNDNLVVLDPTRVGSWQESSGITGMRFTGHDSNTSGSGLHTEGVRIGEDFQLNWCWFEDFADDGITIDAGTQPGMITNVHLFRNGRYGINAYRGGFDIWQSFELANISGDSNGLALIRLATGMNSMINGSSFLIRNVKSEIGVDGTQQNTIILDNLLGSMVTLLNINVILSGTSTGANSIVQITTSRCNLMWSGFSCDSDASPVRAVDYFIDDVVNGVQIAPSETNFFGRYGADQKVWRRLIKSAWQSWTNGDTTPNISTGDRWRTANTTARTITGVDGSVDGQEFLVRVNDEFTTFKHNGAVGAEVPFAMNGSVDKYAKNNDTFHFVVCDGFAREIQALGRDVKLGGRLLKSNWFFWVDGDTTPDISTGDRWRTNNSGATSVTGVDGAVDGQEFLVQVNDTNTTFKHNAAVGSETPFAMNGSADKTGANNDTFSFVVVAGFAREVRRA
jgi:hypothetical protein